MSKRKIIWNEDKLNRYLKEGRGSGEKEMYKPWLNTQDLPSEGRSSRLLGYTTGRVHHFFSDTQRRFFLLLDWDETVVDIREHFPLLNLNDFVEDEDIELEKYKGDGRQVITTTFLITKRDGEGNETLIARSIKYASNLERRATLERVEIERRYWERNGVDFGIVTNKDIDMIRVKNIEWLSMNKSKRYICDGIEDIKRMIKIRYCNGRDSLKSLLNQIDSDYEYQAGTAINVFKSMVVNREVIIDLSMPIDIRTKIELKFMKEELNDSN